MPKQNQAYPSAGSASYALLLLVFATITAQLDRHVIGVLIDPIRAEMAISDTQVSLLQGLAFAVFFSFLGLPFGRLVDRVNRRNILIAGVIVWSLMTACCGLARNYGELFFARMGVGIGEACLAPAAISLLTDYFRPGSHARALGLFTGGSVLGGGGSFIVGGFLFAFLATNPQLFEPLDLAPWRLTFIVLATPGLLVAALLLTVSEPARHARQTPDGGSFAAYWRQHGGALGIAIAGNGVLAITTAGVTSWMAPFLSRTYNLPIHEVGAWIGASILFGGVTGSIIGGALGDSRLVRNLRGQKIWVQAGSAIIAAPLLCAFVLARDAPTAIAGYFVYLVLANVAATAAPVVVQDISTPDTKGQAAALLYLAIGLIGYGGGSTAIALVTDNVFRDDALVRYSILSVGPAMLLLSAAILIAGRHRYQRARDEISASADQADAAPESTLPRSASPA